MYFLSQPFLKGTSLSEKKSALGFLGRWHVPRKAFGGELGGPRVCKRITAATRSGDSRSTGRKGWIMVPTK